MLLCVLMMFSLVACGGGEEAAPEAVDVQAKYGIDFAAEGEQKMSDERAAKTVLIETRDVWLEGKMTFALAENPKTYEDFVEHIGCDASSYIAKPDDAERHFMWVSQEDETVVLLAVFWETPQGWVLYSIGSTNLS